MRGVSLLVAIALAPSPALAQQAAPIRASINKAAEAAADRAAEAAAQGQDQPKGGGASTPRSGLFWSGLALGVAGATTSALGLTAFKTTDSSTGNAPSGAYQACVAQQASNPIYATNQCGVLKGKNLKLLWGGVAVAGAGAALMISGHNTSAELSPGTVGFFHRWRF
ncbi:MAG TPA: hypothetical protein VGY48_18515 [Vicinamibacterales bacterium]|jgi:hypothetical protein|nr:hypothetical protein [Vicinamibacterales bacterium]